MRGDLAVSFSCDPASLHRLVREALTEIEALQVMPLPLPRAYPTHDQQHHTTVDQQTQIQPRSVPK